MAADQTPISLLIQLNPDDHPEERDQLARALRRECAGLPGVQRAELASEAGQGDERGDPLLVGQLALEVAPMLLEFLLAKVADWQRREPERRERIILRSGDRVAEFAEGGLSPAELADYMRALEGSL